jgi:hypothetical protein
MAGASRASRGPLGDATQQIDFEIEIVIALVDLVDVTANQDLHLCDDCDEIETGDRLFHRPWKQCRLT